MSLADDWGPHGITVNCLAPGWFKTKQNAVLYEDAEWVDYLKDRIPLKRPGQGRGSRRRRRLPRVRRQRLHHRPAPAGRRRHLDRRHARAAARSEPALDPAYQGQVSQSATNGVRSSEVVTRRCQIQIDLERLSDLAPNRDLTPDAPDRRPDPTSVDLRLADRGGAFEEIEVAALVGLRDVTGVEVAVAARDRRPRAASTARGAPPAPRPTPAATAAAPGRRAR